MLESSKDEVQSAFLAAKNTNAAVKTFLKREARVGDPSERFAKDFRNATSSGREESVQAFVEKHFPKYEMYFLALARYAHSEFISSTVEKIFEKFADEFNTTYEKTSEGVTVTNSAKFNQITQEVLKIITDELSSAGLPVTNFMKKAALICIFEPDVLKEVLLVVE
jgi:hypothetical protein